MVVETGEKSDRSKEATAGLRQQENPLRAISLILLIMAYASMLPYNALWIEAMTSGALKTPILVYIEITLGVFGLFLLAGYSAAVARRDPWNSPRIFWAVSTLFNGLIATMGILSLENFDAATALMASAVSYTPEFQTSLFLPGYVLTTVGSLSGILIVFWMPIAALLSFFQLIQILLNHRTEAAANRIAAKM